MPRCDYQDARCDEYGYPRDEFPDRHLCMNHYEKLKRTHNGMVRAMKRAGVGHGLETF